jgi:integrating conjugative element protein (TIGR03756 family)
MIKHDFISSFIFLLIALSEYSFADINSATITANTLEALPHCAHYQIRGVCFWVNSQGINTTPYIEQYLPDVVISVFNKPEDNPWTEMKDTLDLVGQTAENQIVSSLTDVNAGSGQHSFHDVHEQQVFFKEVDVIGNPALAVIPSSLGFLPSSATPLLLYYQSMVDAATWRGLPQAKTPLMEEAYAVVADVNHHIGSFPINWGGIYPHEGKITSSNDAKAAAVIAQRAGDLITSSNPVIIGHIYQSLSNRCGEECTASSVQENSRDTQFQMIYPIEQNSCDYFGKKVEFGKEAEQKTKGAYVWVLWRHYKGCANGDGQYVGKTIFH